MLKVLGELCTSGSFSGYVMLVADSSQYGLAQAQLVRNQYTITFLLEDFPEAKKGTVFTVKGKDYIAVEPKMINDDAASILCKAQ